MTIQESKGNVMVVDDTPANLRLLDELLVPLGYEVRPFPKGALALKAAEGDQPDLILLDINMPEMNGYEVCRHLKENVKLQDIPVIFLSARGETLDKVEAFSAGGVDYLTKPFQIEELSARIKTHINLHRYQIEIEQKNIELQQILDKLKKTQTQLVQSEKMASLGVLTAGIAHEINNPVNYMQASAKGLGKVFKQILDVLDKYAHIDPDKAGAELDKIDQLKKDSDFDDLLEGVKELVKNISDGAKRTAEIIKGLRTFSRLDEAEKKAADIHQSIDSTLAILHHKYKDTITIERQYGDVPQILCYPGKLDQVFMNILVNAIDAIHVKNTGSEAGSITIKTGMIEKDGNSEVVISISDTGPGIAPEAKDHLFDPFFTTKDVGEGTGLGLAISQGIIDDHGGSIEVNGDTGKGATFTVYLPLTV